MTNTFNNGIRLLSVLAIFATSIQITPAASAVSMGPLYNGISGDVECTTDGQHTGHFTIVDNVVTGSAGCEGSVTIPQGVTAIGYRAFRTNYQITALSFPDSVVSIGEGAFDSALTQLQTLILPNSLQTIGVGAFIQAGSITTLVIPSGITVIEDFTFYGLRSLTSLTLPTGLTSIGEYAFANPSALTSLTIPNGVTTIGNHAFREAGRLATLSLPSSLTSIGGYVFASSSSLLSYNYCGTSLNDDNLSYAGLSEKTKTCTGNSNDTVSEGASSEAVEVAIAQREAEQVSTRIEIVNSFQSAQTVDAQTFAKAGISGITESNISEVNAEILALPKEAQGQLSQILKIARKYEVVGKISSENVDRILPITYIEIGLISADSPNKAALAMAVKNLSPFDRDSYAEIKAAIEEEMVRIKDRADRLAAVLARYGSVEGR
jgi:hypothetical protein